jgi:AcrR family transcriptional regulator
VSDVPEPLQWIRPPRQVRTQESLERLLDAAEALLSEKCFEDVHVSEVARRAGTSVAAFYRRFGDKDALLHALHERVCEEAEATAEAALEPERWAGVGIREILAMVVPFLVASLAGRQSLDRAIFQRGLSDPLMRERSDRLVRAILERLAALLLARRAQIGHPEPEAAVSFALVQMSALLIQTYTVGVREVELVPTSDAQLARHAIASCLAYLAVRDAPGAGSTEDPLQSNPI